MNKKSYVHSDSNSIKVNVIETFGYGPVKKEKKPTVS